MSTSSRTVRVFTMPQQFPCGPRSSCCGPIGQSEEEVNNIRSAIGQAVLAVKEKINQS
ncbi:MAG: hypothetical protein HPY55_10945 [Firmicutes bacterium]|nr:hypothetical protein [Bacillota bacterium]